MNTPRELLEEVKKRITSDPSSYNQNTFCGGRCCIAGHIDMILNGADIHNSRPAVKEEIERVNALALSALGEAEDIWLFGQVDEDEDEESVDYWPGDLSERYEDAHTAAGRAAVGCAAIDRYLTERGL